MPDAIFLEIFVSKQAGEETGAGMATLVGFGLAPRTAKINRDCW